uniref:Acidic repeat-containing protein-like n=1 Tax=Hirondellea gigas TaxID=1518452 RepID=A0A6A7FXS4_9CRUS
MLIIKKLFIMSDISRLSLDIADLPLTPFGMRSPPVRGIHHRITSSNKLSRNRLKSPASADEKMQLTNLPSRIHESNKENTEHATQAKQIPDKKCLWSKPKDPAIRKLMPALRKPTFYMKTNSKMPALLEENSEDIFIIPEIPKKIAHKLKSTPISKAKPSQPMRNINAILTCQDNVNTNSVGVYGSSSASSSQVCSNDAHSHPIHPTAESTNSRSNLFDNTEMSSIGPTKPQKVLSSTRVEERNNNRRESTMTDIDDGSFVEFTREIPEGRVIPHIDSVTKLRDNLYFTTYSQPNETKYSTSSKLPNARYGFHNLVDAIKKQKLLQQISQENCESSESKTPESALMLPENEPVISGSADVMKALRGPKYKLLNSTMIGDKRQSQYPLCVPDVSTLSTNDETTVDDSIPLNTNRLLRPTPVVTKSPEPQNVKTNTCLPSRKAEVSNYSKIVTQSKSPIRNNQQNNIVKGKNEQHMAFQRVELDDSLISEDVSLADSEQCDGIIPQPNLQYNQQLYNNKSQKNSKSVSNLQEPDKSNTNKHSNQKKNKAVGNVVTVPESEKESGKSGSIEEIPPSPTALVKPASTETRYRMYDTPVKFKPEQNNEVFKHKNDSASVSPRLYVNNTNALPPSSPCVVKPSVYQWVANSPFKDGSFDTSFLRQGPTLTASNQLKSSVLETSSEDELECSLNKVQVDSKKKKQTGGNLDIKTKKTNEKRSGGRKNKYNSTVLNTPSKICSQKVPPLRPENSASSSKSNTNTDSDSKYADSLEMESLRLRLEASTYSAKTSLTIGRVATSPTANECPAAIPVKAGTLSTKILADSDSSDTDASQLPSNSNTKRKKKRMSLNNIVISSLHKKIPINIKSTRETDKKPVSILKKRNKNNNSDLSQPPESSCASPTLKNNQNVMNSHLNKHGQTSLGRRFDSPRKNKSDGESSDDISNYMKKWRGKKATNISSDESDDSFVVDDNCDDSDDESFFLPSLSERLLVDNKLNNKKRQDKGSVIDHSLKKNGETEKSRKCLLPKTPVVYALSDSYEDLPSPQPKSVLQTPGSQVIILSDSDDEPARDPPKPFMTPLPNKTFKATTKKTLICPNTVGPSKPSVNLKIFSYQSMASTYGTPTMSFLSSLSIHPGNNRLHPEAVLYTKNFSKTRDGLVTKLYKLFNKEVFESKLPEDMKVTWNVRMRKTAGFCYYQVDRSRPNGRGSRIELSAKVVDNSERLRDTFAHELCHAAAWIISGYKDGHGPLWKAWANKTLLVFPELPSINRCHNYQISCKFTYKCTKCGYSIGRHSKSLDIERKVCGKCRGHFQLLVNSKTQLHGTATPRTPGPFALFVKDNYGDVKKSGSDLKHNEVMKLLGEKFKELRT